MSTDERMELPESGADENYRQEIASQVLAEQDTSFNEIIFVPLDNQDTNEQTAEKLDESTPFPISDDKQYWCDAATKYMLSLIEDLRPKLGKSIRVKTKNKMYKIASEEMAKKGYTFSASQIENKFRGLERQFKKVTLHSKQTGRNRQTCSFESELSNILGEKRSIIPEFALESGDDEGIARSVEVDDISSETENSQKEYGPRCSNSASRKRRQTGVKEQLMEKLEEIKEEKKEFHTAVLNLLKKKDEREENREKRSQRKMELLEMLVKKNTQP